MTLAADIARSLGNGKEEKNGAGWVTCCPVHGDKTPSLSVTDNDKGEVDVYCHTGCDFKAIKDTLRSMGLLPEWTPEKKNGKKTTLPAEVQAPPAVADTPPPPEKESYPWKKASRDDLYHAVQYFAGRSITIDLPKCIRWGEYKAKDSQEVSHMIVAAASRPGDDKVFAVQRLFIDLLTHKKAGAKMHGECLGRGVWFDRKNNLQEIVVAEGLENMLSGVQATGKNGVAALSTAGVKGLIIPDETKTIYILVDSDPVREKEAVSMVGQKASHNLAARFVGSREDRKAFLVTPDDTCFSSLPAKLDFNDLLKADPSGGSIRDRFAKAVDFLKLEWAPEAPIENDNSGDDGFYPPKTIKALQAMNEKYAAVLLGGDFRIAKEGYDSALKKHTLAFLKITSLYSYYANSKVAVPVGEGRDIEYRELAKVWMGWDGRRTYEDVVFDPSGHEQPGVYNLFRGFPLTPKQGDWSKMRKHIHDVICDGNAEHFEYVMAWMARAVQDPGGDKPGVALVLKGGKGIGKGVFANYFGSIFGEAFLPIADSESFTGKFNMHLSKSLLVFLDEAVWGGDKKAEGKLKQLITEPTVMFEPKGIDSMALSNHINIIIAGNEEWLVPATGDERRFCVLEPSEEFRQNTVYFGEIAEERRNGGAEAMMWDLLRHDFSNVDLRKAPITDALCEQVEQSLPSAHEFWFSILDRGHMLSDKETGRPRKTEVVGTVSVDDLWPPEVFKHEIYAEYCHWCNVQKERYVQNERRFWKSTWKIWADGFPGRNRRRNKTSESGFFEVVFLPPLKNARKAFTASTKIIFDDEAGQGPKEMPLPFDDQF